MISDGIKPYLSEGDIVRKLESINNFYIVPNNEVTEIENKVLNYIHINNGIKRTYRNGSFL